MASREFVIPVRRGWTLWILPTIAIVYFLAVLLLAVFNLRIRGVETRMLALGGVALFALVLVIQLPFFFTRRRRVEGPVEPEAAPAWSGDDEAPPEPSPDVMAPAPLVAAPAAASDDELLVTPETQRGLRVLEYSTPPKTTNKGAVYAKTYVPVTKEYVLRVETVAAERHEV